jgi:hypothetical protein
VARYLTWSLIALVARSEAMADLENDMVGMGSGDDDIDVVV